jgi:tRNA threonylcarbamoyladenosine biosynthesis protein TsaE
MKSFKYSLAECGQAASFLLESIPEGSVVLLSGSMGAGKTTLVNAVLELLGKPDSGSSPTYAIHNEYKMSTGSMVHHFDLYRIEDEGELEAFGFWDVLDSQFQYVFIEWPERVASGIFVPGKKTQDIQIKILNENVRELSLL